MGEYGQFCPVAKAAEVVTERWMPLILRELMCGSRRFSDIQRGVPLISPALLSKRLRQLEAAGVVERDGGRGSGYLLTAAGWELYPIIEGLGRWGQRWARSHYGPDELDPALLMWDIRRFLTPGGIGRGRTVVAFVFRGAPRGKNRYWLVVDETSVDLCLVDLGFEVDLWVRAELRALTQVWMGDREFADARAAGLVELEGPRALARAFPSWLGQHPVLASVGSAREVAT